MTPDEIRVTVLKRLGEIAPEAEPSSVKPDVSLRDQLDLDSMDLLNFAIALHKQFGVAIPESDYPKLATLDGCVRYVSSALSSTPT